MANKILITNLPAEISPIEIEELCSEAGNIRNVSIHEGTNPGTLDAVVTMKNSEDVKYALEFLDGCDYDGNEISVEKYS